MGLESGLEWGVKGHWTGLKMLLSPPADPPGLVSQGGFTGVGVWGCHGGQRERERERERERKKESNKKT